jgi:hypothetical protein
MGKSDLLVKHEALSKQNIGIGHDLNMKDGMKTSV